jgi:hypothetical protein
MVRETARAAESATSPESTKGPFGNEVDATAVGTWDRDSTQGVLTRPVTSQGLRAYQSFAAALCRRPRIVVVT